MKTVFSPLATPLFRRLWLANMTSNLGTMLQAVGAAWLMLKMTGSPEMVALVQAMITLPLVTFSLVAGAMADSYERRRIMILAQCFMLVMALTLMALVIFDRLTPVLLLASTFLLGCGGALHIPAWQASLRDVTTREELPGAVALQSMGFNIMRSVGPAFGGLILAVFGAAVLFFVNAMSYLPLIVVLMLWRPDPAPGTAGRERLAMAVLSGLRYSSMSPNLLRTILRGAVFCTSLVAIVALLPIVAGKVLDGGSVLFGGLLASFGLGALLAAFISPAVRTRLSNEQIARTAFAVAGLALIVIALGNSVASAFGGAFVAGCCWVMANALFNTIIQLSTPKWVVGRSLSILHTGLFGGMALGSWVWGRVAETGGTETALIAAAICLFGGAALGFLIPLPAIPEGGLEPLNRFKEPELALDLSHREGPIGISIRYHIAPDDVPQFLSVMKRRRRIRVRDGAQRWALMRDVENPEIWNETYQVATWEDYVRHNERRTEGDAEDLDRIWALHMDADPPIVRRMVKWDIDTDRRDTRDVRRPAATRTD